ASARRDESRRMGAIVGSRGSATRGPDHISCAPAHARAAAPIDTATSVLDRVAPGGSLMRLLLPVGVSLLAALPAQGVQLSTANVNPVAHANSAHIYSLEFYVPFGTLVLPIIIGNPLQGVSMELRGTATDVSVR